MNQTVRFAAILLLFGAVAGGILAFGNSMTEPIISERAKAGSFGAFAELFTDADDFVPVEEALLGEITADNRFVREIYEAKAGEETIGYVFKTISGGYGGDIVTVSAIGADGTFAGIRVLENSETPGFGSRAVDEPEFRESFEGKSAANPLVLTSAPSADNEVLVLSGATVSSEGILAGVNGAREAFVNFFSN